MTKHRSSSKPTSPINLFRGAIGTKKVKHLAIALEEFKAKGQVEKFPTIYSLASHNKNFHNIITASRKVKDLGQLGNPHLLKPASLYRELQWAAVVCFFAGSLINKFINLRNEFYLELSQNNILRASEILDQIDKTCGKSLWVVENRICLLSTTDGFETQKKYITSITKEFPRKNIAFMAANISERNEQRVTAKAFEQRLRHRATNWDITGEQLSHIFYRLCNTIESSEEAYSAVLAYEASYSAIDLYEALLSVARRAKKMPFYEQASTEAAIEYLVNINDARKDALIRYLKENQLSIDNSSPDYHISFQKGAYDDVIKSAMIHLQSSPWNLDAIVACAKACTAQRINFPEIGWFGETIGSNLCSFFSGFSDAEDAVDELLKLANNFRNADFSVPLIMLMKSRTHRWFHRVDEQCALIQIFISTSPSFIERFSPQSGFCDTESVNNDFKNSSAMFQSILDNDIDEALVFANELKHSENLYYQILGKSFHANLLSKASLIAEAIEESVEALIEHPGLEEFTPLIDILRPRGFRHLKDMSSSVTLSCAFHMYMEHVESSEKDVALKVAWKNLLAHNGITKPSEFKLSERPSKTEAFFLSDVCTQETMELGGAFSSQLDLDRERMAICAKLASAFPLDSERFNQEIVDLTRRINIEDGVQFLESSRIFVDEIGIQKWAKKNLNSQFLRYKDHLGIGIEDTVEQMSVEVSKILESKDGYMAALTDYLENYDITADALLEDVVRELSHAFLQLPRYGLDSFLSSRVRHGSFVGYIRGSLESHRIVTKRKTDSSKYYDNSYLLDRWAISDDRERRLINSRLALLSASIDEILDETVEKILHVRSKSNPDGMVVFSSENKSIKNLLKSWVVAIKGSLNRDSDLESLITFIFESFLWPSVRPSLQEIKKFVQSTLDERLSELLNNFVGYASGIVSREIKEVISADISLIIPDLRDSLRRVSLWFDLPQANSQILLMPLQRVLEIGLVSSQNARFGFDPAVVWNIQPEANILLKGQSISIFNDLTFLIFMNIAKHSGFEEVHEKGEQADIFVDATMASGAITITISNSISTNRSLDSVRQGLAAANEKISIRDLDGLDKQISGTGLARLAFYFDNDDQDQKYFHFWLSEEERRFYVQMQLPPTMVRAIGQTNA